MVSTRRQFIAGGSVVLTTALAGCSSDSSHGENRDSDAEDAADGGDDQGEPVSPDGEEITEKSVEIEEDQYHYSEFDLNRTATVEYRFTVRSGPDIDVFVTNEEEFGHYEDGERFRTYEDSMDTTSGSGSADLGEGHYYVVVDNTSAGVAEPPSNMDNDVIEVDIEITAE